MERGEEKGGVGARRMSWARDLLNVTWNFILIYHLRKKLMRNVKKIG